MTYQLMLGDRAYSSWSLRGWLLCDAFDIAYQQTMISFLDGTVAEKLAAHFPARTVPTLITPEGAIVSESMAIAEELATRHPDAGIWPDDPIARATARTLASEMHAGFMALRRDCPMNLRAAYTSFTPSEAVQSDLRRVEAIWAHARAVCAPKGPWLCGDYSAADAFFAPVAARIAGYGLHLSDSARAYVDAHLAHPSFRRWRAMGLVQGPDLPQYRRDYDQAAWPGPAVLTATATSNNRSENAKCPYSGKPVTDFLTIDGRVFGFCNPFCRDKTVADPNAWPAFVAMMSA